MERLGRREFASPDLLDQALTHASFSNESARARESAPEAAGIAASLGGDYQLRPPQAGDYQLRPPQAGDYQLRPPQAGDNERLEFLGDAVLDLALSELLMRRFPLDREGALSKKRASLVNEEVLASLAREIGVAEAIRLGKGERLTGGLSKPRILASAFEAVFGALFLDAGFATALAAIKAAFESRIDALEGTPDYAADFKTRLQERSQESFRLTPSYRVERESGPDHEKTFEVCVRLGTRALATGIGRNKKAAEQEAARLALREIEKKDEGASA